MQYGLWFCMMILRFINVAWISTVVHSFILMINIPLCKHTTIFFFIHLAANKHLGCFKFWLLWVRLLWTFRYNLCVHTFLFLLVSLSLSQFVPPSLSFRESKIISRSPSPDFHLCIFGQSWAILRPPIQTLDREMGSPWSNQFPSLELGAEGLVEQVASPNTTGALQTQEEGRDGSWLRSQPCLLPHFIHEYFYYRVWQ